MKRGVAHHTDRGPALARAFSAENATQLSFSQSITLTTPSRDGTSSPSTCSAYHSNCQRFIFAPSRFFTGAWSSLVPPRWSQFLIQRVVKDSRTPSFLSSFPSLHSPVPSTFPFFCELQTLKKSQNIICNPSYLVPLLLPTLRRRW